MKKLLRISLGIKQLIENPSPESETNINDTNEKKSKAPTKAAAKSPTKTPAKKVANKDTTSDELKNGGTTNLGALLKAKLNDKK